MDAWITLAPPDVTPALTIRTQYSAAQWSSTPERACSGGSYLSVHEKVPHQGHGLLHVLLLRDTEGLLLLLHGLGSGHHEAGYLVVEAVQGLHG